MTKYVQRSPFSHTFQQASKFFQNLSRFKKSRIFVSLLALSLASTLGLSNLIAPQPAASQSTKEITLVSYAVTKTAYGKIIPKFVEKWKKETGETVKVRESYGGSGSQARAVVDGLEADVTNFALAVDTNRLQIAGLLKAGWEKRLPNNSIVTKSAVVLATRPANPKNIKTWADLAKPGIKVITANPKTSGVARWNFVALWGSVTETGGTEAQAKDYVTKVFKNVPVLPKDAREATDVFIKQRQGDVLLNYENELILAAAEGKASTFALPPVNISIDTPVAVVDKYVDKHGTRKVAEAFAAYLFTPEAQREFAKTGFRSVNPEVAKEFASKYRKIEKLYTINEFGGWSAANSKFFTDGAIFDQIQKDARK
ncbi:sulfate/thiosulfate-binding protein [Synechococcus sp. PCC 7502]|uniref:sulfate ABC transporter substrate-binding protein n=1 Tax=Synechococcus sp. PCC 7502 TaxID=1173263 RepID=UPI00029F83A8|nr:sulfate ABC transporter substrate-binding protein [Synechococcus sp. PCC 7502]AFY72404.1 sulfate/thiosulfate-binding protein [Synechococcus sp. PCC 7502]